MRLPSSHAEMGLVYGAAGHVNYDTGDICGTDVMVDGEARACRGAVEAPDARRARGKH